MIHIDIHSEPLLTEPDMQMVMPESWNELSTEQFVAIAGLLFKEKDVLLQKAEICKVLCEEKTLSKIPAESIISDIFPLIEWVYTTPDVIAAIVPKFGKRFTWFHSPKEGLENITIIEYDFAERYLHTYLKEQDPEDLWKFVSVLYRKARPLYHRKKDARGDIRKDFNHNLISYYAGIMSKNTDISVAYAIMMWYRACRNHIMSLYPTVFNKSDETEGTDEQPASCFNLMRKLAEKHTYGTFEQVQLMNIHEVLLELEFSITEYNNNNKED